METTTTSSAGKGLGIAALVIGIITVIWSLIPLLGATAFWPSIIGLALGIIGLALAIKGKNSKKGIIIAGFVLCVVSTGVSAYWMSAISAGIDAAVEAAGALPVK
ncbi:MAG: hypothetical protein WAQ28_01370 [Bacteroidia bacterium]|jgi:hypothetical protein